MGSIDIDALKARTDIVSVVGAYVALKKRGAEFVGLCPFHADKNPSFWVSPAKQFCHCFSCGANKDVIEFIQDMEALDFKAACERLGAQTWEPKAAIQHERTAPLPERITSKPPPDAAKPSMAIRALGEPSRIYPIRDLDGSLIAYECRYEQQDGKKEIRIWSWGARGDREAGWGVGHLNAPRPLYGLERLGANTSAPVLITEGPKKADAGKVLLPAYASVSWTGGALAWHKHDYTPIAGRIVLIFPDNDDPGIAAAHKLAAILSDPKGLACPVRIVDPSGQPEGWDMADWTGTTEELIAWAKPRARNYPAPPVEPRLASGDASVPSLTEPDGAGPSTNAQDEPPPWDGAGLPPQSEEPAQPKTRRRPALAVVGNNALAPEEHAEPLPASMSEDMLAEHYASTYGANWRHVREWGQWFEWAGDRWTEDKTSKAERLAIQVTREALYWKDAQSMTPRERRQINRKATAWSVRDLAATDRRIAATVDQWDRDPLLLGVPGGVIDLRDGQMLEPEREQYVSKQCAVAPASGEPQLWLKYLDRAHDGNTEVIAYLQRYAGYCATGETKEHALAFCYGTGRNGKGVFLETVSRILGDYARTANMDTFMEKTHAAHSTELARLRGARLVITEEAASGGRWNEARIKHVTGGGKITAHLMRQDDFEFTPSFKLLIAANHKPMLRSVDEAIKARIHLVPFNITIPPEERDKDLLQKLEAEWPQILGWMLDGCAQWQLVGLNVPQYIMDATEQYVEAEDVLGQWLEECCERKDRMEGASGYRSYSAWCERQGEKTQSRRTWSNALVERGFEPCKGTGGTRMFAGLTLKAVEYEPPTSGRYPD